jgi:hypothetical protein
MYQDNFITVSRAKSKVRGEDPTLNYSNVLACNRQWQMRILEPLSTGLNRSTIRDVSYCLIVNQKFHRALEKNPDPLDGKAKAYLPGYFRWGNKITV